MPNNLSLFIEGRPAPQGSKTSIGRGRFKESSNYLAPWRATIVDQLTDDNGIPALRFAKDVPVFVGLDFYLDRPKYLKPEVVKPYTKTPDLDKLCRAVLDALKIAGVLHDDAQVDDLRATKAYAEAHTSDTPYMQTGVYLYVGEH